MKKSLILILFLLLFPTIGHTQFVRNVSKVGTTAASFLEIEIGARALSMGSAFVGVANDITAMYWNPAGLARLNSNEAIFDHSKWLAGVSFDYAGVAIQMGGAGALGLSITTLNMGEMNVRTVFYPEGTGERFDASDFAMGLSYARNLTDRFSIGFSGKYIHQKIWHMNASSVAFDIGTLFTTQFHGMRLGMSITNFGPKMRLEGKDTQVKHDIDPVKYGNNSKINAHLDTDKWSLPLLFRVGVSMDVLKKPLQSLTLSVDANHPNDNTEYVNAGFEYGLFQKFYLRAGYPALFMKDSEQGFSAGAGINTLLFRNFRVKLDYAYANFGVLTNVQRFSVGVTF